MADQRERVRQMVMVSPGPAAAAEPTSWNETFREDAPSAKGTLRRPSHSSRTDRPAVDPEAQNRPQQTINYNFHGVNNVGTRDPRLLRGPRVKAM